MSGQYAFFGLHDLIDRLRRTEPSGPRVILLNNPPLIFPIFPQWEERIKSCPAPGKIRLLTRPENLSIPLLKYWYADMSLTEWASALNSLKTDLETKPITFALSPPNFLQTVTDIFNKNQRARWLASIVLQRWKQRVWRKRTQCNIDLIDMAEIKDRDAILITDTRQRQIFRFHRRDLFSNLIANICMSEEMMPYPRVPTNPWSNVPWTMAQTMSVCAQLSLDYSLRGKCPPVLLAAFCEARFDLARFKQDNASMLSQHAIYSYFKDLTAENMATVYDTLTQLLTSANLSYSSNAISRWLKQIPQTVLHREWLLLVRDYTVYINLHVQVRPAWRSAIDIRHDVRTLYRRTTAELPSRGLRVVGSQNVVSPHQPTTLNQIASSLEELFSLQMNTPELQPMDNETAFMLIGATLFR
jgi:hypothetical protein